MRAVDRIGIFGHMYCTELCNLAPVTQSRFRPRFTTIRPDLSQMVKSGCIGVRRDGKKKINHQYGVSRCSYGVYTIHLRIHYDSWRQRYDSPRWSYECSLMPPWFDTVLVRFNPVASRPPTNVHDLVVVMRRSWGGGGGGLIFSSYVISG